MLCPFKWPRGHGSAVPLPGFSVGGDGGTRARQCRAPTGVLACDRAVPFFADRHKEFDNLKRIILLRVGMVFCYWGRFNG